VSSLSRGVQKNGLPVEVKYFDTIGTHEWGKPSTWPAPDDSKWELEPVGGEAMRLTEVMIVFTENTVIHEGGQMVVEFWIDGNENPVRSYTYASVNDWMGRALSKERLPYEGPEVSHNIIQLNIPFAQPPVLWSSAGNDAEGNPKVNRMSIRIADNQPYRQPDGENAELVRAKYFAEVYVDPDYEP